jgi:DNA-binding NtrC family response regulator
MRVLAIENDELARTNLRYMLEEGGYTVLEASNVSDGLRLARLNRDIGVVLVDIHLEDRLSGPEMLDPLRERLPYAPFILMSGDWDALAKAASGGRVLRKPYGCAEMMELVASAYAEYMGMGGPEAAPKIIRRSVPAAQLEPRMDAMVGPLAADGQS